MVRSKRNHYHYVLDVIHTIAYADNTDPHIAFDARALIINWTSYETIITAYLFLQFFSATTPLSKYIQTKGLDYSAAWNKISYLMKLLKTMSEIKNYNYLKQRVYIYIKTMTKRTEFHENIFIQDEFIVQRQKKVKRMYF